MQIFEKVSCQLNNKVSIPNFIESDSLIFGSNRKIEVRLDELGCTWIKVSFQLHLKLCQNQKRLIFSNITLIHITHLKL
ncbi:hypothetical protein G9C98_005508 [Cotesia typhae]|uniref:Uncharacterized protein n=1 Tax=Cotesia typhae TaxID=2053667 RepID=A0A8J5R337_9HYME|nr:hypothetical protein G9C98_005508 [Cotesia typhae]